MIEVFYIIFFFFPYGIVMICYLVSILCLQYISNWTNHMSSAQEPHVVSGHHTG